MMILGKSYYYIQNYLEKCARKRTKTCVPACRKMIKGQEVVTIVEELGEDQKHIYKIYQAAVKDAPGYDLEKILGERYLSIILLFQRRSFGVCCRKL